MILLGKNDPWPEELRMDQEAGMRRAFPKPFTDVVVDGIYQWMRVMGQKPTHIMIHPKFKQVMKVDLGSFAMQFTALKSGDEEIMGLKIVNTLDAGLELLGDIPQ